MTQEEVRAKYEERRLAEEAAFLRGEEHDADRRLNDAREGVATRRGDDSEPARPRATAARPTATMPRDHSGAPCWPPFHDPKGESRWMRECGREEPIPREKKERRTHPYELEEILRLWVQEETGRLSHPLKHAEHESEDQAAELATLAWNYVSETKGWCAAVHEAMRHLYVRRLTWEEWPRFAHHTAVPVTRSTDPTDPKAPTFTEWEPASVKPTVGKLEARAAYPPFMRELERRVKVDPFVGHGLGFETR